MKGDKGGQREFQGNNRKDILSLNSAYQVDHSFRCSNLGCKCVDKCTTCLTASSILYRICMVHWFFQGKVVTDPNLKQPPSSKRICSSWKRKIDKQPSCNCLWYSSKLLDPPNTVNHAGNLKETGDSADRFSLFGFCNFLRIVCASIKQVAGCYWICLIGQIKILESIANDSVRLQDMSVHSCWGARIYWSVKQPRVTTPFVSWAPILTIILDVSTFRQCMIYIKCYEWHWTRLQTIVAKGLLYSVQRLSLTVNRYNHCKHAIYCSSEGHLKHSR